MKRLWAVMALAAALSLASPCAADDLGLTPAQEKNLAKLPAADQAKIRAAVALDRSLHRQTGDVRIPSANLTLHLGSELYYLPPEDARRVLVQGWGNPAQTAANTLGLVFPKGESWLSEDGWGANITFDAVGYVSSVDDKPADYAKVDQQMRDAEADLNAERQKSGAPAIHYVGWAQPPTYDPLTHTAVWARDLQFAGAQVDTLNYDLRSLGRHGVLSMNIISAMPQIGAVRRAAGKLQAITAFDQGSRYADYHAGDKKTGYGIAGLIAAGAGLVVAKKAGLLALLLLFGKKAAVLIAAAFAAVVSWIRKITGRKPRKERGTAVEPPPLIADPPKPDL